MVLAAGRGERMRPLTDHTPKPLLQAGGKPLIFWHLERLSRAGFRRVIINHAHLGEQIETAVGTGSRWALEVRFSPETQALETAGGIANALPLIDADAFAVVNADIYADYDYAILRSRCNQISASPAVRAHLVLVDNPAHHRSGDFALSGGKVNDHGTPRLTFSGLGAYRRDLFRDVLPGAKQPLAPLLRAAMSRGEVTGEHFRGRWYDIGTPERLHALEQLLGGGRT